MIALVALFWRTTAQVVGRAALVRLQLVEIANALVEAAVLGLLIPLVAIVAGNRPPEIPVIDQPLSRTAALILFGAAVLVRAGLEWWSAVRSSTLRLRTVHDLRLRTLSGVLHADWTYVARQRRSDIVQAATTELERVDAALGLLLRLGVEALLLGASAVVALAISPVIGIVALVTLAAVVALTRRSIRRTLELGLDWNRRTSIFSATVTDSLSSLRLIRAHDAAPSWTRLLRDAADGGRKVELRYVETTAGLQSGLGVLAVTAALGLVVLGKELGLGLAALLTLALVTSRMLTIARGVLQSLQAFTQFAPALHHVLGIIDDTAAHADPAGRGGRAAAVPRPAADRTPPTIQLRGVTAGYADVPALRDLDLTVPAGETTVLTGPSGSGKSTLLDVLLGLLTPANGEITVDGVPLTDLALWRSRLAYVPQQTVLVPSTVRENLSWSAGGDVSDDDLWRALKDACVADVVRRLPDGLDTELLDFTQLSGGEQQRLCIARALVREPEVLLLDEATSALDVETEREVLSRLRRRGCTTVLATHRQGAVGTADHVLDLTRT
ncbi:ABC transporter ATP-binding protein [Nocardioides montaniterrae]